MSYTGTTRLDLKKADIGSNQAFETSVINANWNKVDAEAIAVDTRLDTAEGTLVTLDGRLDTAEGTLVTLDGRVDTAEADIIALQAAGPATPAVNTQTGTSYSTLATDAGDHVRFTSSSAVTVTITSTLAVGEHINFVQDGTGAVTFAAGAGVTLSSVSSYKKLLAQYAWASVICVASGQYRLVGSLTV